MYALCPQPLVAFSLVNRPPLSSLPSICSFFLSLFSFLAILLFIPILSINSILSLYYFLVCHFFSIAHLSLRPIISLSCYHISFFPITFLITSLFSSSPHHIYCPPSSHLSLSPHHISLSLSPTLPDCSFQYLYGRLPALPSSASYTADLAAAGR